MALFDPPPRPVDKFILKLQSDHGSKYIWSRGEVAKTLPWWEHLRRLTRDLVVPKSVSYITWEGRVVASIYYVKEQ